MNMSDKDNEKELSANPEDLGLREPGAGDDGAGVREGTVAESAAPDDGGAEASAAGEAETVAEASETGRPAKFGRLTGDGADRRKLTGMYKDWFLDYASYVILERAVPHVDDGLKPVQRRILHAMRKLDDGRYNKVANIIGSTMQYHPHGDASIGDALVQLGQKDMLIDCQGNWGNILTGDGAAAPRYIEARLSKFALDVVFNPKTTEWMLSYDGRNQEPVTLPVKFPLLLARRGNRRRTGVENPAAQFQRAGRRVDRLFARRAVRALSRFPVGRAVRRDAVQRRIARRGGQGPRADQQDRQADARDHRDTLRHDDRVDQGIDHQSQRQG